MTEKEWLNSKDGVAMEQYWGTRFTERKARLLTLACCRRHPDHLVHPTIRAAVDAVVAHYADPVAPDTPMDGERFRDLYNRVMANASARSKYPGRGVAFGVVVTVEPVAVLKEQSLSFRYIVFSCLTDVANGVNREGKTDERPAQAALVREILGNPFRRPKPKVKAAWRTDTVMALARQTYAADEFGALPILADALQDAGCDCDAILDHLRDTTAPHVRGCWALDLVLGKK